MSHIIEIINHRGFNIQLCLDEDCTSPRQDTNLGTIVCHRTRNLDLTDSGHDPLSGDHGSCRNDFLYWINDYLNILGDDYDGYEMTDEHKLQIENYIKEKVIWLPIYAYIHNGTTIKTRPLGCKWDSGQTGYIFCTKYDIAKWNNITEDSVTEEHINTAMEILQSKIKILDEWLQGECYGFTIPDLDDSCWGYIGDEGKEAAIDEAKAVIDSYLKDRKQYSVIVNMNIEYKVFAKDKESAQEEVQNLELPSGYVEDSFEIIKVETL